MTLVVTDDVVVLSTVVVAVVVVDSDDTIEDVREVELVEGSADVDAEDVVIDIDESDDVSVLVEDVMADVEVTLVDTTSVEVVDVELAEVGDSSVVLEKEVTEDVESVVVACVVRVVSVLEDSVDVADELKVVIVCCSRAVGASEADVDSMVESEAEADVKEELIRVKLSICRTVLADAVYPLEIRPARAKMIIPPNTTRMFIDTNSRLRPMHQ